MVSTTQVKPFILSVTTMIGNRVENLDGEHLGKIEEIVIDVDFGCVAYAVLSFGGFLGLGDKLFAIPWRALAQSEREGVWMLHADKEALERAEGLDKDDWPKISDRTWVAKLYGHYQVDPYW